MSKHLLKVALRAVVAISVLAALTIQAVPSAQAAAVTSFSDTLSTETIGALSNHTIRFITPTGVNAPSDTIVIEFDADFTMGTFALLNFDFGHAATCAATPVDETLATTAAPGVWGVAQSGLLVTFTAPTDAGATEIPAGNCVTIDIGTVATFPTPGVLQITNPGTVQTATVEVDTTSTFGDSGVTSIPIITSSEVQISANVNQSITFTITNPALDFGTLLAGTTKYATSPGGSGGSTSNTTIANVITVGTNATSGLVTTVVGGPLTSGANTITSIPLSGTPTTLAIGSEQFGVRVNAPTPPVTEPCVAVAPFDGAAGTAGWGADTVQQVVINAVNPVNGPCADTIFNATYGANITTLTEPGAYSMVATWVTTGTF